MFSKAKQKNTGEDEKAAPLTAEAKTVAPGASARDAKRSSAMRSAGVPSIISADVAMRATSIPRAKFNSTAISTATSRRQADRRRAGDGQGRNYLRGSHCPRAESKAGSEPNRLRCPRPRISSATFFIPRSLLRAARILRAIAAIPTTRSPTPPPAISGRPSQPRLRRALRRRRQKPPRRRANR